jgi:hypothetical protein
MQRSKHHIVECDVRYVQTYPLDLDLFDAIVIHYSVMIFSDRYLSGELTESIRASRAAKVLFIQDEYRRVDDVASSITALGVGLVFTVANKEVVRRIYHHSSLKNVRFENCLTGYVPEELAKRTVPPFEERELDVIYRARKLPGWLGEFGQQKWIIGARFNEDAPGYDLNCDISSEESDRIYGDDWVAFVENAKAVLGTESGASFIDFTGDVQTKVEAYEAKQPTAEFEDVQERFLEGRDGDITISVISPRCFEAAALRTLMILYPGEYSGVLTPYKHYVPLQPDHSNMREVVDILCNPMRAKPIIDAAYQDVACSDKWTFGTFVRRFDDVVNEHGQDLSITPASTERASSKTPAMPMPDRQFDKLIAEWSKGKARWSATRRRRLKRVVALGQLASAIERLMRRILPDTISDWSLARWAAFRKKASTFVFWVLQRR